ncbi:MAG: hypothetical protein M3Y22_17070 [Pseudomonadota bacterium]|nr:hypothetical protein [Pseudomonadota bacterium]
MVNLRHHSIRLGRVLLVSILLLVAAALVALAAEPLLRLGMFLGLVAPHLPAPAG